jgi:plastocyanin
VRRAAALSLVLFVACAGRADPSPTPSASTRPYVITAIDYHFHDAHPSLPIDLARRVEFRNVGRNIHNVTFRSVEFSQDVPRGKRLGIDPAVLLGSPGEYAFFCRYHRDRGMAGVLVIRE